MKEELSMVAVLFKKKIRFLTGLLFSVFFLAQILAVSADNSTALSNSVLITMTSKDGNKAAVMPGAVMTDIRINPGDNYIHVFSGEQRQMMLGIGGAITEAAAYNISTMPAAIQEQIFAAYFSQSGSEYAVVRVPVGSCDFALSDYSYDDGAADPSLDNFSIDPDRRYLIPAIQRALGYNPGLKIFAAPWAPPAWMKKSGVRSGNGPALPVIGDYIFDNAQLKPEYYQAYADYLVKYLRGYQKLGITVWSLSVQNEAQNAPPWEGMTYTPAAMADFIGNYLGPALVENNLDTKLLIWDWDKGNDPMHRDGFINFNTEVLSDANATQYIYGTAFHWYAGDIWHEIAGDPMWSTDFASLDTLRQSFPQIHLLATEGCQEKGPWLNDWTPAARYIYDMINDFEAYTETWIDWNIVLRNDGGPTHDVTNQCHAPVMVDPATNAVIYNPSYYVLKQFSRNIRPGFYNIKTTANLPEPSDTTSGIFKTAFLNPADQSVVLFVGNTSAEQRTVKIVDGTKGFTTVLQANSLTTFKYDVSAFECTGQPGTFTAQSSSDQSSSQTAAMAIDQDSETRWASSWNDSEWLKLDMGTQTRISGVAIDWECGYDSAYEVQTSVDGLTWTTVRAIPLNTNTSRKAELNFSPVTARYLKIQGIQRNNSYGYSIYEIVPITAR
jgi:glucosylceramidase